MNTPGKNIAIVTDQLASGIGGAESITFAVAEKLPGADIYTTVCEYGILPEHIKKRNIHTTFLQKLPRATKLYKAYLPLMPTAIEYLDLQKYDIIFSSHHCAAKGIIPRPDAIHICYCHSPARYIWDMFWVYSELNGFSRYKRLASFFLANYLRMWDVTSSNRVNYFIANSSYTAARIAKFYNRKSRVIYPPVETARFSHGEPEDFYFMAGRLVAYKRFDLAIRAFNASGKKLVIVGDGVEYEKLRAMAGPNITMPGKVPSVEVVDYMSRCRGFVFPGREDFGIVMAEAQAAGKPVIAFRGGGALDIVLDNETGVLFEEQSIESLNNAVKKAEEIDWDHKFIARHAKKFDKKRFMDKLDFLFKNARQLEKMDKKGFYD